MENKMSDTANPYQSPQTDVSAIKPMLPSGAITETMIVYLKGVSPWLRFLGILGFIACAFIMLLGLLSFILPGFFLQAAGGGDFFGGLLWSFFCVLYAVFVFFPSRYIYLFGTKVRAYIRSGADSDLEEAFKNNKSFWKFAGILAIICLAVIPVMILSGVLLTLAAFFA
jgi:hypothetical protein